MMRTYFTRKDIVKSFVDGGMLDCTSHSAPDLMGVINLFKINWDKAQGGKKHSVSII